MQEFEKEPSYLQLHVREPQDHGYKQVLPIFQGLSPIQWIKSTALMSLLCAPVGF